MVMTFTLGLTALTGVNFVRLAANSHSDQVIKAPTFDLLSR
jgi:hypothetical protein